ncbi:isoprenylcysteine carboxyl methyltransferase family protein [Alistipes sp.]|uniref:isoprenylcysteine carboxyl methyltransferase family protein n=1 Tax=Alistipes sp. TaxID=1872444 RepID=UPI003AF0DB06
MCFALFLLFVLLLRLGELLLARRNGRWLRQHGAVEYGRGHYPQMVALHTLFFLWLVAEYLSAPVRGCSVPLLMLYLGLLAFKAWAVLSLGHYWNTRIYRIPGAKLVCKGPYRFLRHPNYLAVAGEIFLIPMIFHLYATAVVFTLLDAWMLRVRIAAENRALDEPAGHEKTGIPVL